MMAMRMGRISDRPGAKVHMEIDGQGIGENHSRHVVTLVADADIRTLPAESLCKRCFSRRRIEAAWGALTGATGIVASHTRSLLSRRLAELTPARERAELDELAARVAATIELAAPVLAQPVHRRPSSWAALRAEFKAAGHPDVARARY